MCTGLEVAALIGAGASAVSAVSAMSKSGGSGGGTGYSAAPVVEQKPVADQDALDSAAAQDAQAATLAARRRARSNSLLSAYGGTGDPGTIETSAGAASGKTTLGA